MEVKPGYKQTEVGVIPEDWGVKPLSGIAQLKNGYAFKSSTYSALGGFNVVTIANVQDGFMDVAECNKIDGLPRDIQPHHRLELGDVLISMTGNVGRVCRVTTANCLLNQRVGKLVPSSVDASFLFLMLGQRRFLTAMAGKAKGGAQGNLSVSDITDFLFPFPPTKAEQEAIAEALSDADALIESLEQLVAKNRQLKQGAMQELLTRKKRLPGFSGEWEVKRLGELAEVRSGGTPSTTQSQFWDGDVLWCTPTDITGLNGFKYLSDTSRKISQSGLKSSSAEIIPANSVVMTSRATIGECAINRVPVSTNQGFKNFTPFENVNVEFLYYLLLTQKQGFISLCGGSTFLEIGKAQLAAFKVRVPTTKAEQTAIAAILSDMDGEIAALEAMLAKARQLKQGMMQKLLTGRIRLV
jgi:type I restriction enzyme S subunit